GNFNAGDCAAAWTFIGAGNQDSWGPAGMGAPPAQPTLKVKDASVFEGAAGATTTMKFKITLSAASATPVTVHYATANGTATAPSDYKSVTGTLTIPAGTTTATVKVKVKGDATVEPNETVMLNLSNPSGATIADGQGAGTIKNDD